MQLLGGFGAVCIGVVQSSNYQMGAFDQIRKNQGRFGATGDILEAKWQLLGQKVRFCN
ncbi:hypothetical protein M23134_05782 [Microscilla marina ATCC 23134]|uniref:Uncharacterized protein n=1 Tax=Microscilla marina ATCC 23134 TaxID=313606 RepID=A1ZIP1_MICM2|nr:hypothetical protein M23134_05782 [Microscilla marina ATCC 23134]